MLRLIIIGYQDSITIPRFDRMPPPETSGLDWRELIRCGVISKSACCDEWRKIRAITSPRSLCCGRTKFKIVVHEQRPGQRPTVFLTLDPIQAPPRYPPLALPNDNTWPRCITESIVVTKHPSVKSSCSRRPCCRVPDSVCPLVSFLIAATSST